eukprot:TRINITY_DN2823_c0_g1_i1.p1 TRINITY_DN2823_c0_g1~~TRINITY_DN2823_c0_g1_i1.p1  ORF type:complete len:285 (+),score=62.96 TRINITY_DN2823_c0_g1_i1:64-918(+)
MSDTNIYSQLQKGSSTLVSNPSKMKKKKEKEKKKKKEEQKAIRQPYRYYLVLDFEATCEKDDESYRHEIIEMPVVVVDAAEMKVVQKWQTYVKPVINPKLTKFCTELTGITQDVVDKAPVLKDAMSQLDGWIRNFFGDDFDKPDTFTFATDGPWDFRDFFWYHSVRDQKAVDPDSYSYFKRWINIRELHAVTFSLRRNKNVKKMLSDLGLVFEGRPHSGIDDASNIAKILIGSLKRGTITTTIEFAPHGMCESELEDLHRQLIKRCKKSIVKGKPLCLNKKPGN